VSPLTSSQRPADDRAHPPSIRLGASLAIWAVPAVLMVLQMYAMAYLNQAPRPPIRAIIPATVEWLIWAPLTPLVLRLGRRFPLRLPPRPTVLAVHLAAIAAAALIRGVVYASVSVLVLRPTFQEPFAAYAWRVSLGWLPFAAVVYSAILGIGAAFEYRERTRQGELRAAELEGRLARAELEALRAHLHPHFLFNALHTVSALARRGDSAQAVRTIAELSELLRELLRADRPDAIPLAEELAFLRRYLAIVALRFRDRMTVAWQVDPECEALLVPRMVLQPLVENAVRHGISARGDAGRLSIAATLDHETLILRVTDDGPGPGTRPTVGSGTPGTGLATLRARLRARHGSRAGVTLEAGAVGGAVATVRLPALTPAGAEASA
jgi:two-component system, LytTR family, sensor kinase